MGTRHISAPYGLTKALKASPVGTELIVGSTFFLLRVTHDSLWEVWLTPRRCHFRVDLDDLSREARQVVDRELPRFVSLFTPEAKKVSPDTNWTCHEVTEITADFIYTPDFIHTPYDTEAPVNAFCILGNWCTLAGPYVFLTEDYGRVGWGWLRDINVAFIEKFLEINFISNDKPWLSPSSFGDFVIASSKPCSRKKQR